MAINLTPWRDARRIQQQRDFVTKLIASGACALGLTVFLWVGLSGAVSIQESNNKYLQGEIDRAEEDVKEIKTLEEKRDQIMMRRGIIEQLQSSRNQLSKTFVGLSEAGRGLGITFTSMKHKGGVLEIEGRAVSNAVVAAYITRLSKNPYIGNAEIVRIKADDADQGEISRTNLSLPYAYSMRMTMVNPNAPKEEEADLKKEPAKKDSKKPTKKKPAKE